MKYRKETILVYMIILVSLAAAGILMRKDKNSYEKYPIYNSDTYTNNDFNVRNFSADDVKNAKFLIPNLSDPNFFVRYNDVYKLLVDGYTPFVYCEYEYNCKANEAKNGSLTVSNITIPYVSNPTAYLSFSEEPLSVMVLNLKLVDREEHYLVWFTMYQTDYQNNVYTRQVARLDPIGGTVKHIILEDPVKGEITLIIEKDSGELIERAFTIVQAEYSDKAVELTSDKKYKIYNDNMNSGYSFKYPVEMEISNRGSKHATILEDKLDISPIYFVEKCDLEPTFADDDLYFYDQEQANGFGEVKSKVELAIHKISSPALYLASDYSGTDISKWNNIEDQIVAENYINKVKTGAPVPGKEVVLENINGFMVRHITPFNSKGICKDYREQYQWVTGDFLFSLIFTGSSEKPFVPELKKEIIDSIFSSLTVK